MFTSCCSSSSEIQNIFNLDCEKYGIFELPKVLNQGQRTMVFEYSEDLVVLLTMEKEKFQFLENLSDITEAFTVKRIKSKNFPFSPDLENIFLSSFYSCFFMTKGETFDTFNEESSLFNTFAPELNSETIISNTLMDFTSHNFDIVDAHTVEDLRSSQSDILSSLNDNILHAIADSHVERMFENNKGFPEPLTKELTSLSKSLLTSIEDSLKAINEDVTTSDFIIDIHSEQFVKFNDTIVCIDPVMYDYDSFI